MSIHDNSNETTSFKGSYKPVIIVHGLMTGNDSTMNYLATRITELHPGTKTYVIDRFCGLASLEPMWRQTKLLADDLLRICSLHPEGVHVIGYSQGGLLARGMLESYGDKHNVKTFVSLSSPQGGQYGAECFTKMFPALTARTAYEIFYTSLGQHTLSVANYWYDPNHRDLYIEYSVYLAVIDNIKIQESHRSYSKQKKILPVSRVCDDGFNATPTTSILEISNLEDTSSNIITQTNNAKKKMEAYVSAAIAAVNNASIKVAEEDVIDKDDTSTAVHDVMVNTLSQDTQSYYYGDDDRINNVDANIRKLGLTRLQWLILIGGPDDEVISPWQSSQFGVLDSTGDLVLMKDRLQDIYRVDDPIGLRELNMNGRIIEYTMSEVGHHEWHRNERVLHECIIDWLD